MRVLLVLCLLVGAALASENECNKHKTCPRPSGGVGHFKTKEHNILPGSFELIHTPLLRLGIVGPGTLNAFPTTFASANTDGDNPVGLRWHGGPGPESDGTSPGCYCEGFGTSGVWASGTTVGSADQSSGFSNIVFGVPTAIDATSVDTLATVGATSHAIEVSHQFRLSASPNAFEVRITLTNKHPTEGITRLRYERQMDWDIHPTTFDECVDIDLGNAPDLPCASTDGFVAGNPDVDFPSTNPAFVNLGDCGGGSFSRSLFGHGPRDHGAAFLIQFHDINSTHPLLPGESKSFLMYYGAAATKAAARAVVTLLQMEAFSLGYPSDSTGAGVRTCGSSNTGAPNTFLWGFAGLGGTPPPANDCGGDCKVTTTCPTATSATAATTTQKCASIRFDGIC